MRKTLRVMTGIVLLSGTALAADSYTPTLAQPAPSPFPPPYQVLRFNENGAVYKGKPAGDIFDAIKHVPLNDSGSVWVSFGGQVRERYEVWENFNFGANGAGTAPFARHDDAFLLSRFMLYADLHVGENIRVFAEGKSALITDRTLAGGNRTIDVDTLDLQNGFVDLIAPLDGGDKITFRAGRQELLFGKQRLVGPLDWVNARRTFDGFSAIVKLGDWTLTPFYVRPTIVEKYDFNDVGDDHDFYGLYATGKVPTTAVSIDLYWLGLDKEKRFFNGLTNTTVGAGSEHRQTVGGRLWGKLTDTGFDYEVEGAYQFGEFGGGADIAAYMATVQVGYTVANVEWAPRFWVNFDYASGDENPGGPVNTFNQLFPTGHLHFGQIDEVGRQNILALSQGVTFKPIKPVSVEVKGNLFWRAENSDALYSAAGASVRPAASGTSSDIGAEFDIIAKYQFDRHTEFSAGYGHFFPGDFIKQSSTAPHNGIDFLYFTFQFTF